MKTILNYLVFYPLTIVAVLILLGEPDEALTLGEIALWKGGALLWLVACYCYDGKRKKENQFFEH